MARDDSDRHQRYVGRLGRRAARAVGARTVYGKPVERDGVTVIPVAAAVWGFGGGSGGPPGDGRGGGAGGGGGGIAYPVGYIRIADGRTSYRPIVGPGPLLALGGALALAAVAVVRRRPAGAARLARYHPARPKWRNGRRRGLKIPRP